MYFNVHIYIFVCVCERERERARVKQVCKCVFVASCLCLFVFLPANKHARIRVHPCTCVPHSGAPNASVHPHLPLDGGRQVGSRLHDSGYDKRTYSLTETHVQDAIDDACLDLSQYGLEGTSPPPVFFFLLFSGKCMHLLCFCATMLCACALVQQAPSTETRICFPPPLLCVYLHVQGFCDLYPQDVVCPPHPDDTRFVKLGGSGPITLKNFSSLSSRQIKDLRNAVRPHAVIWWTVFLASVVDSQHLRIV